MGTSTLLHNPARISRFRWGIMIKSLTLRVKLKLSKHDSRGNKWTKLTFRVIAVWKAAVWYLIDSENMKCLHFQIYVPLSILQFILPSPSCTWVLPFDLQPFINSFFFPFTSSLFYLWVFSFYCPFLPATSDLPLTLFPPSFPLLNCLSSYITASFFLLAFLVSLLLLPFFFFLSAFPSFPPFFPFCILHCLYSFAHLDLHLFLPFFFLT